MSQSLAAQAARMAGIGHCWGPVNYRLFGGNYVNLYILCSIVVICKTKQSQFSQHLIVSIIDHTCIIPQHLTIKSLLAPILCTLYPSPNQHTSHQAHGELLITHTAKPISTNLWQFSWRVIIYPSPVLWSIHHIQTSGRHIGNVKITLKCVPAILFSIFCWHPITEWHYSNWPYSGWRACTSD